MDRGRKWISNNRDIIVYYLYVTDILSNESNNPSIIYLDMIPLTIQFFNKVGARNSSYFFVHYTYEVDILWSIILI